MSKRTPYFAFGSILVALIVFISFFVTSRTNNRSDSEALAALHNLGFDQNADGTSINCWRPVTSSEARATFPTLDIPPEASSIMAAGYHEWLAHKLFIKSDAPKDVCESFARSKRLRSSQAIKRPTTRMTVNGPLNVPWFDPETIAHGTRYDGDTPDGVGAAIWVDHDHNSVFYMEFDR
jgi:hypothetical protein